MDISRVTVNLPYFIFSVAFQKNALIYDKTNI